MITGSVSRVRSRIAAYGSPLVNQELRTLILARCPETSRYEYGVAIQYLFSLFRV